MHVNWCVYMWQTKKFHYTPPGFNLEITSFNYPLCTISENLYLFGLQMPRRSIFTGITWDGRSNSWLARITHAGVLHKIGLFDSEEEAARAWVNKLLFV